MNPSTTHIRTVFLNIGIYPTKVRTCCKYAPQVPVPTKVLYIVLDLVSK